MFYGLCLIMSDFRHILTVNEIRTTGSRFVASIKLKGTKKSKLPT